MPSTKHEACSRPTFYLDSLALLTELHRTLPLRELLKSEFAIDLRHSEEVNLFTV